MAIEPTTPIAPASAVEATNARLLNQNVGALIESLGGGNADLVAALNAIASAITASIIGGSTGGTDNRLLRAKGTGGRALDASPLTAADDGDLSGVDKLTCVDAVISSRTAYAVLAGGTTSADPIQSVAGVGTSGQVLTSNGAAALPTFQNAAGVNRQQFDADGTWNKPSTGTVALIQCWGAGGSGGRAGSGDGGGGGGGGAYVWRLMLLSALSNTETVTVGTGGTSVTTDDTNGNAGENTTFGSHVTAYGGGGGAGAAAQNGGGGGGGQMGAGASSTTIDGANGGTPRFVVSAFAAGTVDTWGLGSVVAAFAGNANVAGGGGGGRGGSGAAGTSGGGSVDGGGGGGGGSEASGAAAVGGDSINGGGGGGGGSSTTAAAAGGSSLWGGAGGAGNFDANNATGGTQPGGGGGGSETGNSGAGGDGRVIVTVW